MKKINIEINWNGLLNNFNKLKKENNYNEIIPVIKANAYNFGVYDVVKTLLKSKIPQTKYIVFSLNEGIMLRKLFSNLTNIFILSGLSDGEEFLFKKYDLTPIVTNLFALKLICKTTIKKIVLEFNTGMNRFGCDLNEIDEITKLVKKNNIIVEMIMSHLCCANDTNSKINSMQIENFNRICEYFPCKNILKSLCASDGVINLNCSNISNIARVGLSLYGYYEGFEDICKIFSFINYDGKNLFLPIGLNNGFSSEYGNSENYVTFNGVKIYISSITNDKIILNTNDKSIINKEVIILGKPISYKIFEKMCNMNIREVIARIIANNENSTNISKIEKMETEAKSKNTIILDKNKIPVAFYATILQTRIVSENGIVGYDATANVKKYDCLATISCGYLDGLPSAINGKKSFVIMENKNFTKCEIFGKISMDSAVIKIDSKEFNNIKIGDKVIIFNEKYPISRFENITGKTINELFFYLNKSYRNELIQK